MADIHADRILILDFGAQYTQLIARRVRELGVYSEIHACDVGPEDIKRFAPAAVSHARSERGPQRRRGRLRRDGVDGHQMISHSAPSAARFGMPTPSAPA